MPDSWKTREMTTREGEILSGNCFVLKIDGEYTIFFIADLPNGSHFLYHFETSYPILDMTEIMLDYIRHSRHNYICIRKCLRKAVAQVLKKHGLKNVMDKLHSLPKINSNSLSRNYMSSRPIKRDMWHDIVVKGKVA